MLLAVINYTFKTLFRKKGITIVSILCIACAISGLIVVGDIVYSYQQSYEEYITRNYGTYTAIAPDFGEWDVYSKKLGLQLVGKIQSFGVILDKDTIYDKTTCIGTMDENAYQMAGIRVIYGRKPQFENEIMIEKSAADKLGLTEYLDKTVQLQVQFWGSDTGIVYEYTIVGYFDDYTCYQEYTNTQDVNILPSILVGGGTFSESGIKNLLLLQTQDPFDKSQADIVEKDAANYQVKCVLNKPLTEDSLVGTVNIYIQKISQIILLIIVFISCVCLYLYTSYTQDTYFEKLNDLKLAGANGCGLGVYSCLEGICIYVLSVPVGILFSLLFGYISNEFIAQYISYYFHTSNKVSLVIALILPICYLAITRVNTAISITKNKPIINMQKKEGVYVSEKFDLSFIKNIWIKWSLKTLINHAYQYTKLLLLFFIGMVVTIVGMNLCMYVDENKIADTTEEYVMSCTDGNYITNFQIPYYTYYGINSALLEELRSCSEIKYMYEICSFQILIKETGDCGVITLKDEENDVRREVGNDTYYFDEAVLLGIDEDTHVYRKYLYGVNTTFWDAITENEIICGNIDKSRLSSGEYIAVITEDASKCPYQIGDKINILQYIRSNPENNKELFSDIFDVEVTVDAIIEVSQNNAISKKIIHDSFMLLWDLKAFEKNNFDLPVNQVYLKLNDSDIFSQAEDIIGRIKKINTNILVISKRAVLSNQQMLQSSIKLTVIFIQILVTTFCILTLYSVIYLRYHLRTQLYGRLQAIGVSKWQLYRQYFFEILSLQGISFFLSIIILKILFSYTIRQLHLPFSIIAIWIALITAICFLIGVSAIRTLYRKSIVLNLSE